ncbi:hypothetical protein [Psychrobacter sp. ANT_WB68]|uniref:hypothetical protein n=1 Tax=Psychrobacter sp. ANT_WB68 TaxID=2597355 RepID=UPI0011F15794|nr:hypothetical protein [Psychrobacter sp. ANT_WB68]KAA0913098.1 hypothetical protein FQ084_11445 [Psychrobacter sp. ANT_WB68]
MNKNLFDNNERILFKSNVVKIMILDRIKRHRYYDKEELEENLKLVIEEFQQLGYNIDAFTMRVRIIADLEIMAADLGMDLYGKPPYKQDMEFFIAKVMAHECDSIAIDSFYTSDKEDPVDYTDIDFAIGIIICFDGNKWEFQTLNAEIQTDSVIILNNQQLDRNSFGYSKPQYYLLAALETVAIWQSVTAMRLHNVNAYMQDKKLVEKASFITSIIGEREKGDNILLAKMMNGWHDQAFSEISVWLQMHTLCNQQQSEVVARLFNDGVQKHQVTSNKVFRN